MQFIVVSLFHFIIFSVVLVDTGSGWLRVFFPDSLGKKKIFVTRFRSNNQIAVFRIQVCIKLELNPDPGRRKNIADKYRYFTIVIANLEKLKGQCHEKSFQTETVGA